MNQYGQTGLQVDGHSRGGMTTGNALEAVASQNNAEGTLNNTNVSLFGSAYNAQQAANFLNALSSGNGTVQSQVHIDDFVGTIIGGNAPSGGTTPEGSSLLQEWIKIFYGESTVHNGYGEGQPNGTSNQYWLDSPSGRPTPIVVTPSN